MSVRASETAARRVALALLVALLAGCTAPPERTPGQEVAPEPAKGASDEEAPMQLRARQLIVTLADPAPESWVRWQRSRSIARDYGLREIKEFPLASIGVQCVVYAVPPSSARDSNALDALAGRLASDPRVESAQRNQTFSSLGDRTADVRAGYSKHQYGPASIRADRVHATSTGKGVTVAVIDTGMDVRHPDLQGRVSAKRSFVQNGDRDFTRDAHGTAVAGVIAAADDQTGIVGIAPGAELLALKACWYPAPSGGQARCSSWSLALALDHAIRAGARVINLSLSGPPDPLLARLVEHAAGRGQVVVAAASTGPAGGPGFPASLDSVIGVVPSDVDGRVQRVGWRKRGQIVAAPGIEILTTAPGRAYGFQSGSSLAAAHVSGVMALMFEAEPALDAERAARLLGATTRPLLQSAGSSAPAVGLVDACAALRELGACG